jgi:hypothetical protein
LERLASPQYRDHWDDHRAIANFITELTTSLRDNIIALAEAEREGPVDRSDGQGTPYMETTTGFDDSEFPPPPEG